MKDSSLAFHASLDVIGVTISEQSKGENLTKFHITRVIHQPFLKG